MCGRSKWPLTWGGCCSWGRKLVTYLVLEKARGEGGSDSHFMPSIQVQIQGLTLVVESVLVIQGCGVVPHTAAVVHMT